MAFTHGHVTYQIINIDEQSRNLSIFKQKIGWISQYEFIAL